MQEIIDSQEKEKVIGPFKPKEKFIEFIGMKGNIHFIANEALIEGKYLSGLDLDDIMFKLTICDEDTVNLEEVDTNKTTPDQRQRLLDVICEKTITPFNKKMVIPDLKFKSVNKVMDKTIDLYLSVNYETPISRLASIFEEVKISDDQSSKLDDLLSLFDDDSDASEETRSMIESLDTYMNQQKEDVVDESKSMLEESFKKMKEEKVEELQKRLEQQKSELKRFEYEKASAEKKIFDAKTDIRVLESRVESLKPNVQPNGYYFHVSERLNEKITLEESVANLIREKISKVKSINTEGFMKLFEAGEYNIKIGQKSDESIIEITDYNGLSDEIKKSLSDIGISVENDKLVYLGEMTWHEIVDKMIRSGFSQDPEFDKISGSNSYFTMYGSAEALNELAEKQNIDNLSQKFNDIDEEKSKFKDLAKFESPTDIVIIGDNDCDYVENFSIDDDESYFTIYQNNLMKSSLSSTGFASIMTLDKYQKLYKNKGEEMAEWEIVEAVLIPNFVGTIGIAAVDSKNQYHTNIDLDNYIQDQFRNCSVVINIPNGFDIIKLNSDLSIPKSAIRDIKIDILNK